MALKLQPFEMISLKTMLYFRPQGLLKALLQISEIYKLLFKTYFVGSRKNGNCCLQFSYSCASV